MTYIYIVYYRYDCCEDAYIDGVYENLNAAKNAWKEGAIDFLSIGPDDVSEYRLIQIEKTDSLIKELEDFSSLDASWIEDNIENDRTMKVLEMTCDEDLYDILRLYCKEYKLDEDDCWDIIDELSKEEFHKYAEKVLN